MLVTFPSQRNSLNSFCFHIILNLEGLYNNKGKSYLSVPNLRFPEFEGEWSVTTLQKDCKVNPTNEKIADKFVYVDLESVTQGQLNKYQILTKEEAPSRAQRVLHTDDILFQCVRPYQMNNYMVKDAMSNIQWVASTGYAQIRTQIDYPTFLYYVLNTPKYNKAVMVRCTGSSYPAINSDDLSKIPFYKCGIAEQRKIATFLSLLDERIATQNKIIEDLKKLKSAIIEIEYTPNTKTTSHIGNVIEQISKRNKNNAIQNVLSVSNRQGFIKQSDQFENRNVASEDTSNYKIVEKNDFAFNPARINVGSIARLTTFERGIVSPMYICFRTQENVAPEYIDFFFESKHFYCEIQKRLEGSVRQCLSFEGLCNIPLSLPSLEMQQRIGKHLFTLGQKIKTGTDLLELLNKQKQYLLRQMFI